MRAVMVRYRTKADKGAENEQFVKAVFEELQSTSPPGFHYATFKQADGVSFVHIATMDSSEAGNPLAESPAFQAFVAGIKARCEEPPVAVEMTRVGSYDLYG